ncbi:MAG TPA: hemolysin family protein [Planctomycetaceae bacterium]|nr:hemolysin family protein [Planctomycetaceae bacterium]
MTLLICSVAVALGVSALCSLAEATLLSLTPSQVAEMSTRRPTLGRLWQDFKTRIDRPISVILIVNTSAHTVGAALAGAQFDSLYGTQWIWLFSLVFTYLMLQFTEILPKTLGVRYNRRVAAWIGRPLKVLVLVFDPLIRVIRLINRPFEGRRTAAEPTATVEEIAALAGLARLSRQITVHQERIIKAATRLSEARVSDVMIPVEQVAFLSASMSIADAVLAAHIEAHTRFPACEDGDRNRVLGYVNFKEMVYHLRTNPHDTSLRGIIRPVHFVPPDETAAHLLRVFVDEHGHIAMVRSDDGRTLGLVTMEDLIEELVGELEDEFDRLPRMIHPLTGGLWMVGGGVPLSELNRALGLGLPEVKLTLSSWLQRELGPTPKPGQRLNVDSAVLTVRRVRRGKVFEVAVSRADHAQTERL